MRFRAQLRNLKSSKISIDVVFMELKDFLAVAISVVSAIIAVLAIYVPYLIFEYQRGSENRRRTINLHEYYLSPDFYMRVRAPAWQINAKWHNLPGGPREEYQRIVASAWMPKAPRNKIDILYQYIPNFKMSDNQSEEHYQYKINAEGLTEHQILTIYLKFWSELWIYIERGLVDRSLVSIFYDDYSYPKPFIKELREYVKGSSSSDPSHKLPDWIQNTEKLEIFLEKIRLSELDK